MNPTPDANPVYAQNVVGKVVVHIPLIGTAVQAMRANILVTVLVIVLLFALTESIKILLRRHKR
jgi:hypothetical protein